MKDVQLFYVVPLEPEVPSELGYQSYAVTPVRWPPNMSGIKRPIGYIEWHGAIGYCFSTDQKLEFPYSADEMRELAGVLDRLNEGGLE